MITPTAPLTVGPTLFPPDASGVEVAVTVGPADIGTSKSLLIQHYVADAIDGGGLPADDAWRFSFSFVAHCHCDHGRDVTGAVTSREHPWFKVRDDLCRGRWNRLVVSCNGGEPVDATVTMEPLA